MHKYETMFILRPDLGESEKTEMFNQIKDTMGKSNVNINSSNVWAERRKLFFQLSIKGKSLKFSEGLYYLVEFESEPAEIKKINSAFRLNENILRFLITTKGEDGGGV